MFYKISNEKYEEIIKITKSIYTNEISKYNNNAYDEKEKVDDIYMKFNYHFHTNEEKYIFYLNLLINDNKKALEELNNLYETYLEVDNMNNAKPLIYYVKNGYKEKCDIILTFYVAYYDISQKEALHKVNELIQYRQVLKGLNKRKINKYNYNIDKNEDIDLIKVMREFDSDNLTFEILGKTSNIK